ncbi:MAG: hypothetical protein WBG02_00850 [Candidatus Acidiferrum sp.]
MGWGLVTYGGRVDPWGLNKFFAFGGALIAAICFGIAALYGATGRGLLKLQNWARIVSIVLAALSLVSSSFGIVLILAAHAHPLLTPRFAITVVIDIWILIYLLRPHVKQAFGGNGR